MNETFCREISRKERKTRKREDGFSTDSTEDKIVYAWRDGFRKSKPQEATIIFFSYFEHSNRASYYLP